MENGDSVDWNRDPQHKVVTFEWKALGNNSPSSQKRQDSYTLENNASPVDLYLIWVWDLNLYCLCSKGREEITT